MWISSAEFAEKFELCVRSLQRRVKRQKILSINTRFFVYCINDGIGRGGKVLRLWDEPFESESAAVEFLSAESKGLGVNIMDTSPKAQYDKVYQGDKTNQQENKTNNEIQQTSAKAQNVALEKMSVVKEWERARTKMSAKDFIASTNAKGDYSIEISENKLYAWQRAYKNGGFNALIDTRGANKKSEIENLGLKELVDSLIMASRGRVNVSSIHRLLHAHLASLDRCDMKEFLAKESEVVSYGVLDRYVRSYLRKNPLQKLIIQKGEDGAVSAFLPALGVSNHRVNSINQIVEIDATSIDAIIDTSILARELGLEATSVEAWQKRFVLIGLIDTYSGVCSFHISDTENSLGVSRAIAKYIMKYGKPKIIKSDNGSAFVSRYIKEVLLRLDIQSERTPAYSGWCKPFVERNFGRLQNHLTEWLKGYIGHSVSQRQAIEFFFSRAQRRLKRGQKSNQKDLHTLNEIALKIDEYADSFMNNAYLARIEKTPTQAYNERASEKQKMSKARIWVENPDLSAVYNAWDSYARSVNKSVSEALSESLQKYVDSGNSFEAWKLEFEGKSVEAAKFQADLAKKQVDRILETLGAENVTIDNFMAFREEALKTSFDPQTIERINLLGEYLMSAADASKKYEEALKDETKTKLNLIDPFLSKARKLDEISTDNADTSEKLLVSILSTLKQSLRVSQENQNELLNGKLAPALVRV